MAIGFDKTAIGFIKRPLGLAVLDKTAIAADKFFIRDSAKLAICSPNLKIWPFGRFWPQILDKTAMEAANQNKTAIGLDKLAIGLRSPLKQRLAFWLN